MTDGSLFNIDALESGPTDQASGTGPATLERGQMASTGPATDAAAPKSLYRKYRPQSFDSGELFGQEHILTTLRNAISLDRIAHAYLFCGPRGTGKTTTARLLAKAGNCLDPDPTRRPCNQCEACVAINTGATTDVIEIDAASNRGIDDIRDLRERVKYAPSQLQSKFYIIDEAHQITGAAANAFLKTLEEPPAHTKFILATTDPEELLQTIVSRCQRFDFRRIGIDAITACLTRVATAEKIDIDEDAKIAIARHATGSMRDALGLLDQLAVYRQHVDDKGARVTADLVRTVLGLSKNERVQEMTLALADKDAGAGLRAIGRAVEAGDDIRQLTRQLLAYLRLLLLERAGGATDLDEAGRVLAQRFQLGELVFLTRLVGGVDFKVKHATISQLPLETAIVEGVLREPQAQEERTLQPTRRNVATPLAQDGESEYRAHSSITQGRQAGAGTSWRDKVRPDNRAAQPAQSQSVKQLHRSSGAPVPENLEASTHQPAPAQAVRDTSDKSAMRLGVANNGGVLDLEAIVDGWARIKADVKAVNRRIEALLQQIDPIAIEGGNLTLVSPYEFHRNRVNTDEVRLVIEEVIARQFGAKVTVMCLTRNEVDSLPRPQPGGGEQAHRSPAAPFASTSETASSAPAGVENDHASEEPMESSPVLDTERQIQTVKNIFDAEIEEEE